METGNANVAMSAMTSPGVAAPAQWMQYGAGIVPRQSKWYPNGHMSSNGVAIFDHMSPSPSLQTLPSSPAGYFSPLPRRTPTDGRSYSTAANAMLQQQQHQVNMPLPVAGGIDESGDFMPKFPPPMFDCIPDIADSNSVYEFVDADAASRQRHYPVMYHDLNHHNHTNHQLQLQQQHQQQQQQQQQQNYQQLHQLPPHRLQQQQQQVPVGPPTPGWSHQTPYWTSPPPQSLLLASSVGAGSLSSGRSNSSNSSPSASAGTCASSFNDDVIPTGHSSALPELGDMPILPPSGGVQQNNNTPTTNSSNAKRTKSPKKRKRRDPNEPQKPVSAYSLFFRNAQAAIKNRNPSATFGDVSKIVASMWDNLDENVKNYYKRQMEAAKKDYLKQLAVYRANLQATNNTSTSKNVSEDSAEATGSSNETEADQSNCSPPTSAVLLPSSGGGTGDVSREKTLSSPAEAGSMLQPSPAGQQTIPGTVAESISGAPMTSFHSGNGPAMHAHPATAAAMFGPANGYYEPPTTYILPETERYMRNHVTPPGAAFGRYPNNGYNYSNIRSSTASGYQLSPPPQQPTHHQPTAPVPFQTGLIPGHPQHYQQLQQKPFIAGHPSADFQLLA